MTPSATVGEYTIEGCAQDDIDYLSQITSNLTDAQIAGIAPRPDQPLLSRQTVIDIMKDGFAISESSAIKKVAHLHDHAFLGKSRANDESGKSVIVYWITDKGRAMMNNEPVPDELVLGAVSS